MGKQRMGRGSKASLKQSLCPFPPQEGRLVQMDEGRGRHTDPHLVKDWVRYGFWAAGVRLGGGSPSCSETWEEADDRPKCAV